MSARRSSSRFRRMREPLAGHEVLRARARGGMDVLVAPMSGFRKTFALLCARFGALDTALPDGTPIPQGTAHFLEHEMFQKADGDVFAVFDRRGAHANAFTTHTGTSFCFWCSHAFEPNLDTLLATVRHLEVDDAWIEREKQIIGQEIAMYDDDPSWRGYQLLMRALYRRHPVRGDIAGTAESIARIDARLLRAAHEAYYHPRNLVLVVTGNVEPGRVLAKSDAVRSGPSAGPGRRARFIDTRPVVRRLVREEISVSRPHVWLGMKDVPSGGGKRLVERQVASSLVLEILLQDGGRIQAPLYQEGIVDDTQSAAYESEPDFGHAIVSAEVEDADAYRRRLTREWTKAAKVGVDAREVERARRRLLGGRLRVTGGPESLAHWLLAVALESVPLQVGVDALRAATPRSVTRRLRALATAPRSWAVLEPA